MCASKLPIRVNAHLSLAYQPAPHSIRERRDCLVCPCGDGARNLMTMILAGLAGGADIPFATIKSREVKQVGCGRRPRSRPLRGRLADNAGHEAAVCCQADELALLCRPPRPIATTTSCCFGFGSCFGRMNYTAPSARRLSVYPCTRPGVRSAVVRVRHSIRELPQSASSGPKNTGREVLVVVILQRGKRKYVGN